MGRKVRDSWPLAAIAAIVAATAWVVYVVWRSPHRDDLATFGSYAAAVAVAATALIGRAWEARSRNVAVATEAAEVARLADLLAGAVKEQWTRAAADRELLQLEPIAVRWRKASAAVAGPVSSAVGSRRFPPLPGLPAVDQRRLRGGRVSDLHAVYGGLGSGRLMITGAPGAGKSGAAVLLVLAAIRHREQVPDAERQRVPVPVMFTLHGWDPYAQRLQDWLTVRLRQTYSLFAGKAGAQNAAGLLAAGRLAVILDGLDEIPGQLRAVALRALSQQAGFRLVVLARSAEMAAAAPYGLLEGAAALELQDIDAVTAASYLTQVQLDPAPGGWRELTDHLRRAPDSPIARALSSPLTLTLVRDTYRDGDDIRELLELCGSPGHLTPSEAITDHLLDRVLPAAYARRPGDPPPRYELEAARRALAQVAARMQQDGSRDLLWWRIRDWVPAFPRICVSGLAFGLAAGIACGFAVTAVFGLACALTAAVMFSFLAWFRDVSPSELGPRPMSQVFGSSSILSGLGAGIPAGLVIGLPVAFSAGLPAGLAVGLTFGLAVGLAVGIFGVFSESRTDDAAALSPQASWRNGRTVGLAAGLAAGLIAGIAVGLADGLEGAFAVGLAAGTVVMLALWRSAQLTPMFGHLGGIVIGLTAGAATALVVTSTGGRAIGLTVAVIAGATAGPALGLAGGLMYARTWPAALSFVQLAVRWDPGPAHALPGRCPRAQHLAHRRSDLSVPPCTAARPAG